MALNPSPVTLSGIFNKKYEVDFIKEIINGMTRSKHISL